MRFCGKAILALTTFVVIGCGVFKKDNEPQEPSATPSEALAEKRALYCTFAEMRYIVDRYVHGECDGVGFTALFGVGCPELGITLNHFEFADTPGRYSRDPQPEQCVSEHEARKAAGNPNRSPTTDSRDMALMRLVNWWHTDNLPATEAMVRYLEANDWHLCPADGATSPEARFDRCRVTQTLKATIYETAAKLGMECGSQCKNARAFPQDASCLQDGFELHLAVLNILLRGTMQGGINDLQVACLKKAADKNPGNALFQAVKATFTDGDMARATEILLNPSVFPAGDLPTTANYCTEYLWQRDQFKNGALNDDWAPCSAKIEPKSGTDFALAAQLVLTGLRRRAVDWQ